MIWVKVHYKDGSVREMPISALSEIDTFFDLKQIDKVCMGSAVMELEESKSELEMLHIKHCQAMFKAGYFTGEAKRLEEEIKRVEQGDYND